MDSKDIECSDCGELNENRGVDGRANKISGGSCENCGKDLDLDEDMVK